MSWGSKKVLAERLKQHMIFQPTLKPPESNGQKTAPKTTQKSNPENNNNAQNKPQHNQK